MDETRVERHHYRVLVAEDDVLLGRLIRDVLGDSDFAVIGPVRAIDEAIHAVRTQDIDCAILDVNLLGRESGPVAEVLLRRLVPFIVMTGRSIGEPLPTALAAAPRLTKPFRVEQLVSLLARTAGRIVVDSVNDGAS